MDLSSSHLKYLSDFLILRLQIAAFDYSDCQDWGLIGARMLPRLRSSQRILAMLFWGLGMGRGNTYNFVDFSRVDLGGVVSQPQPTSIGL